MMWGFQSILLVVCISHVVVGDQHKYEFVHDKFEVEYLDNNVIVASGELFTVGHTKALNFTFKVKIDLPDDAKTYFAAVWWMHNGYTRPLVQFTKPTKQALDLTIFDLQKLFTGHFQPTLAWPVQKGVTYRSVGWAPDATKCPPNLPQGKWKLMITATFGNKTAYAVTAWYLKIVYKK